MLHESAEPGMLTDENIAAAKQALENHGVIAYPTEAVFGLGCAPYDEIAVRKILGIKQRPVEKGVILIAADYSQLLDYVDDAKIGQDMRFKVFSHWPGPITLLLPAKASVPKFLKGEHDTIAVRVTAFEPVRKLCRALNTPLVSTSANRSGQRSLIHAEQVSEEFQNEVSWIWHSPVGHAKSPSKIINPFTGEVFRA